MHCKYYLLSVSIFHSSFSKWNAYSFSSVCCNSAGTTAFDFETEPLGIDPSNNKPVFLRDIWPSQSEIQAVIAKSVHREMFLEVYSRVTQGTPGWNALQVKKGENNADDLLYPWESDSTYIHSPPFFQVIIYLFISLHPSLCSFLSIIE